MVGFCKENRKKNHTHCAVVLFQPFLLEIQDGWKVSLIKLKKISFHLLLNYNSTLKSYVLNESFPLTRFWLLTLTHVHFNRLNEIEAR